MNFKEFIRTTATKTDACLKYREYPKEVQECLENIYRACWRFCLRETQIRYMLNEALKAFEVKA